jgi:hypothetical protein
MPRLSAWSIRLALLYLFTGFTLGGLLLFHKGMPVMPWAWGGLPAHIEFLLLGWTFQLVLGVAFWILPRMTTGPKRGNESLAWASFVMLNTGIWLVVLGHSGINLPGASFLPPAGRMLEFLAAVAFAVHAYPRVRPTR